MESMTQIDNIKERLLEKGRINQQELDILYRYLCKHTHPDLTGWDSDLFLKLQETYESAKEKIYHPVDEDLPQGVDVYQLMKESGLALPQEPRTAFMVALNWYFAKGLYRKKVQSRESIKHRVESIMTNIIYWARRYDENFLKPFFQFNKALGESRLLSNNPDSLHWGKKIFVKAAHQFCYYQENGSIAHKRIALDAIAYSMHLLKRTPNEKIVKSIFGLLNWFQKELDQEPCRYRRSLN
jgi:hypothetical protein